MDEFIGVPSSALFKAVLLVVVICAFAAGTQHRVEQELRIPKKVTM